MRKSIRFTAGSWSVDWNGFSGVVVAFTADGERSFLGRTWQYEEAKALAREYLGGEPEEEHRPAGYQLFPFP